MSAGLVAGIVAGATLIGGFLLAVFTNIAATDAEGWLRRLSEHIVDRASRRLPGPYQERGEEWQSEIDEFREMPLSMLVVALRIAHRARATSAEAERALLQPEADSGHRQAGLAHESGRLAAAAATASGRLRDGMGRLRSAGLRMRQVVRSQPLSQVLNRMRRDERLRGQILIANSALALLGLGVVTLIANSSFLSIAGAIMSAVGAIYGLALRRRGR